MSISILSLDLPFKITSFIDSLVLLSPSGCLWSRSTDMSTVNAVLKVVVLYLAELVSSVSDWFQTKAEWANQEVLEDTELKTTGGSESADMVVSCKL